jgi:hypothetical protein
MTQFTCKGVKQINNRISLNMSFTFTIHISRHFSSVRGFQMGNFQKYWLQNVSQDFIVLNFFHGRKILKVDGRDGRDPQNREKNAGRFTCMFCLSWLLESCIPVIFICTPTPLFLLKYYCVVNQYHTNCNCDLQQKNDVSVNLLNGPTIYRRSTEQ